MRTFFRWEVRGCTVPEKGPVLLVANHPNSILDPGGVCAAARRPVRFLAKAPFFDRPLIGSLMRATGSIPVYRRMDDPGQIDKNEEMFRAVRQALSEGSAVGIFPEGMTHNLPAIAPLRTGAARIALGTAKGLGKTIPVIPIGLFFHRKEMFRSKALALIGEPVLWEDLADRGELDSDAVRDLTRRIDDAIRAVTLNLERWEDAPAVESAAAIYAAEFARKRGPEAYLQRLKNLSAGLERMRARDPERVDRIFRKVLHFREVLARVGLEPGDLSLKPDVRAAGRWMIRRLPVLLIGAALAILGRILFYLPYRLTGVLADRLPFPYETQSTVKVLGGTLIHLLWVILLSLLAGFLRGVWFGVGTFVILTLLAFLTVALYERVRDDLEDARRFLLLRRRDTLHERLLQRRGELAREIEALRLELESVSTRP